MKIKIIHLGAQSVELLLHKPRDQRVIFNFNSYGSTAIINILFSLCGDVFGQQIKKMFPGLKVLNNWEKYWSNLLISKEAQIIPVHALVQLHTRQALQKLCVNVQTAGHQSIYQYLVTPLPMLQIQDGLY